VSESAGIPSEYHVALFRRLTYTRITSGKSRSPRCSLIDEPEERVAITKPTSSRQSSRANLTGRLNEPNPVVDVRAVLFTVSDSRLLIALHETDDGGSLPRSVPSPLEALDATARRIIREATGLQEQYLEQLYTLSFRDNESWSVVVSYIGLICSGPQTTSLSNAGWTDANQLPRLSDADSKVIEYALFRLRAKLGYTNIAFHLLPRTFTLTELQNAYESILGRRLDKRNFRRRAIASGILQSTNSQRREGSHRPAALYRFRAEHDPADYLTPAWADEA
jgi:8-oxo-dGTP diphosphatase